MEVCEEAEQLRKLYKYKENLYESLNVKYDAIKSIYVFCNKYQIFIHDSANLASPARILTPEFLIHEILVANNCVVCLDLSGNIHIITLKFKNSTQKRFKSSFLPREEGILQCTKYTSESSLSLKAEFNSIFLCQNKINTEFQLEKKIALKCTEDWPERKFNQKECIVHVSKVSNENTSWLKVIFPDNILKTTDWSIVLVTFDKLTIYACLINQRMTDDAIKLVKIYSCPSEICDFTMSEESKLIVGLTCGTLIVLPLKEKEKTPTIIHLNTALSKFIMLEKDTIIYTNSKTIWKAENIFSKDNIKFHQYFAKYVKDFIIKADQIICTTYSNFIYSFPLKEDSNLKNDENVYSSAENILNNAHCLKKVTQQIDVNKEIINEIDQEGNYLTAVALSKRPDIMNKVIEENVILYENFEAILKDTEQLILTESLEEYLKPNSFILIIKIATNIMQHGLSNILTELLKNVNIHITLISEEIIIKTTSVKLNDVLKSVELAIPIPKGYLTQVCVEIKLILNIPGTFDKKQEIWTVLHKNTIQLNIEHFIKTEVITKICNLKEKQNNIEDLIIETAENLHGNLFSFTNTSKSSVLEKKPINLFVKLPVNYREIFQSKEKYSSLNLNRQKKEFLENSLSSSEFLNSKSDITYSIGIKSVKLEIISDDFSTPVLKVSSKDVKIASEMRNCLANFIYEDYSQNKSGEEFVSNALYTTTENIQKVLKSSRTQEDYTTSVDKFHRYVLASLPL